MAIGIIRNIGGGSGNVPEPSELLSLGSEYWTISNGAISSYTPGTSININSYRSGTTWITCSKLINIKHGAFIHVEHASEGGYTEYVRVYDTSTSTWTTIYSGSMNSTSYNVNLSSYEGKDIQVSVGVNNGSTVTLQFSWNKVNIMY